MERCLIIVYSFHQVAERTDPPKALTFGWQRIQLLGAFFNGVLLFGLGISVFLQSIERFISVEGESPTIAVAIDGADIVLEIEKPKLVLIMGCVGFGLNLISVLFLHGMDCRSSSADFGLKLTVLQTTATITAMVIATATATSMSIVTSKGRIVERPPHPRPLQTEIQTQSLS